MESNFQCLTFLLNQVSLLLELRISAEKPVCKSLYGYMRWNIQIKEKGLVKNF
jgi:hypothetical protein